MNKKIISAINKQINGEFYSAYIYLGMSAYLEHADYPGAAHWMRVQAKEEAEHAMKLFSYLTNRGAKVELYKLDEATVDYKSVHDVFEKALKHEEEITEDLNSLASLALKENDHTSYSLLQWYLDEQVEEIAQASGIVAQLKLIEDEGEGLYLFDRHLAERK